MRGLDPKPPVYVNCAGDLPMYLLFSFVAFLREVATLMGPIRRRRYHSAVGAPSGYPHFW